MASIQAKVSQLEKAATSGSSAGGECPECGGGGGDDFGVHDTYELVWIDPGGPDDREEFCEACGWQLVVVLTWGDS